MKKTQITIWTKWIAVIEVTIAVILLTREVYQLLTLRSVYAPDDGLIIEFEKYKEDTYAPMFMWYILFLAGIMSLRKNRASWIINQTIILLVFLSVFGPILIFARLSAEVIIFLGITTAIFIAIEILLLNKAIIESFKIEKKHKIIALACGIATTIIYWICS